MRKPERDSRCFPQILMFPGDLLSCCIFVHGKVFTAWVKHNEICKYLECCTHKELPVWTPCNSTCKEQARFVSVVCLRCFDVLHFYPFSSMPLLTSERLNRGPSILTPNHGHSHLCKAVAMSSTVARIDFGIAFTLSTFNPIVITLFL